MLIFLTPFWPPPNGPLPEFTSFANCAAAAAVYSDYYTYTIGGANTGINYVDGQGRPTTTAQCVPK